MKLTPLRSIVYTAITVSLLISAMFDIHTVSGSSMSPSLKKNETVIVFRWAFGLQPPFIHRYIVQWGNVQVGDVLILREPENHTRVLKRCAGIDVEGGRCYVLGDNFDNSRDSRHYGYIELSMIEGKVVPAP
ncbi:MAG: S26 family signal peptidase [Spirochaetaceae bacterium]